MFSILKKTQNVKSLIDNYDKEQSKLRGRTSYNNNRDYNGYANFRIPV